MLISLVILVIFYVTSIKASAFEAIIRERHSNNLGIYHRAIEPIFARYGEQVRTNDRVNVKKFVSVAEREDIIRVLVGLKTIIPEADVKKLKILEQGFFLFHFKPAPRECAEFMINLTNGPAELERMLRKDRQVAFDLVHKLVRIPHDNNGIVAMGLHIYGGENSFVNEEIIYYNAGIYSWTYLLHEACKNGNSSAVRLLMNYGADPTLLAGNRITGPKWDALHSAVFDRHGTDTLMALMNRHGITLVLTDDGKKRLMRMIVESSEIPDELKFDKIEILKRFRILQ